LRLLSRVGFPFFLSLQILSCFPQGLALSRSPKSPIRVEYFPPRQGLLVLVVSLPPRTARPPVFFFRFRMALSLSLRQLLHDFAHSGNRSDVVVIDRVISSPPSRIGRPVRSSPRTSCPPPHLLSYFSFFFRVQRGRWVRIYFLPFFTRLLA